MIVLHPLYYWIIVNLEISDEVKQLHTTKNKQELLENTNLSISTLNMLIRKIGNFSKGEPTFKALFKKARNIKNKDFLHTKIRDIMGMTILWPMEVTRKN